MPYEVKGKCIFKKYGGAKVGCTKGSVDKYLAALHANANESVEKPEIFKRTIYRLPKISELKEVNDFQLNSNEILEGFKYTIVGRGIMTTETKIQIVEAISNLVKLYPNNNEYKIALNKANEIKPRFISENKLVGGKSDNLSLQDIADKFKVPVTQIQSQIQKGIQVEMEHTNDKEKATEIATDHVSEFADYYNRLDKMENKASKDWKVKDVTENTKSLIKRLIRENLTK